MLLTLAGNNSINDGYFLFCNTNAYQDFTLALIFTKASL